MVSHEFNAGSPMTKTAKILPILLLLLPASVCAWWNSDWKQRTVITLNTSEGGVTIQEPVTGLAIPVRLHSGNFDFVGAKPDGSDLRVLAGDDKTPLKFWVERFDSVNELAVLWVQVPSVLPGTDKNTVYVYAGNDKAATDANSAGTPSVIGDAMTMATFHFAEKDGIAVDQTGAIKATAATAPEPNGLIGQSARLTGTAITWAANDKLKVAADAPFTVSLWIRPDTVAGTLFSEGPLQLSLAAGKLSVKYGNVTVADGDVAAATWSQVVATIGTGKFTLYVDGAQVGQADVPRPTPAIGADVHVGDEFQGMVDELELSGVVRSADWIRLNYAAESADARLIATRTETSSTSSEGGSNSYFGILFKSLTPDAWVVIGILGVMFLIAIWVMVNKSLYIIQTDKANQTFLKQFRDVENVLDVGGTDGDARFGSASLYRLYSAGLRELIKRKVGQSDRPISPASIDAVKATIDADLVREGYRLNGQMVLLTIAIAGGPFLGLLGTVIGVMITFASIAAAGDVNVNAIAPGIAAALLATVAGLSVAIPSLFGYNYLASRIKTISSDMQIFVDEFVTRVAESYGAE
jgi:biopolymer transport protein ExbB